MRAPAEMVEIGGPDTGIVEGAVDPSEGRDRRIQHRLDLLRLDHLDGKPNRLAARLADQGGGFLRALEIEVGGSHACALLREKQRGRPPDAVRGPGNQRRLVRQHSGHDFDSPFRSARQDAR